MTRPLRSLLFMPASNARAIAKARSLPCDAVILDLEDAVAPEAKARARAQAVAAMAEDGFGGRSRVVRVNAPDTPWGADDIAAIRSVPVDAILLPKIGRAADLQAARAAIGEGLPIWAMIETCTAILHLAEIARAAAPAGVAALVFGGNDLAKEMRCTPGRDRAPLIPALAMTVTAARTAGILAFDGVCNAIHDDALLAAECAQGAALGFDGKTLIHPAQITAANSAFSASDAALAWAQAVIAAFAEPGNADKGAIRLDGAMVERLHLAEARRIVASR